MDPSHNTQARVIVTRPVAQSDRLSAMINDAGGKAIRIPALEIRSTDNTEATKEVFARIGEFQTVLFISPNAVRHSLQFVSADELARHRCIAIGASTAQAMTQAGIECDAHPKNNFTSEALLELPVLQDVNDENILIIRGNGGRALLGNELTRRGANITYAEVYQRQVPEKSGAQLNELLKHSGADLVVANSGETLANIVSMVDPDLRDALFDLPVVTGSARVGQAVTSAGFRHAPLIADSPDDSALMDAINRWPDLSHSETNSDSSEPLAAASTDQAEPASNNLNDTESDNENPMTEAPKDTPEQAEDAVHSEPEAQYSADNSDSIEVEVTPVEAAAETVTPPPPAPPAPKRSGAGVAWLALLTALLAAAGTAWNWWQGSNATEPQEAFDVASLDIPSREDIQAQVRELSQSQSGQVTQELRQFDGTLDDVKSEQTRLASQVRTQKRSVENLTDELTQMSDSISAMRGVSASVRNTWVRAETEYFLQTANTRLQLAGDVKSAIQALKAADERIVSLGDPSLTPVRAQVSEDLLALESLPSIDIEGIALSLNSLASKITTLPLRNQAASNFVTETQTPTASDPDDGAWDKVKSALSDTVSGFIRVTPTEDAGAALLAPEQSYFLYRNLELQLQAARIAALQSNQTIFNDSLTSSKTWLESYFNLEDSGVQTVMSRISQMEQLRITQELPDISRSLNLIRAVVPESRSSGPGGNAEAGAATEESK